LRATLCVINRDQRVAVSGDRDTGERARGLDLPEELPSRQIDHQTTFSVDHESLGATPFQLI
jgi:hypothetical protein